MKSRQVLAPTAPPERDAESLVAQAPAHRGGADDGARGRVADGIQDALAGRVIGTAAVSGTVEIDGSIRRG